MNPLRFLYCVSLLQNSRSIMFFCELSEPWYILINSLNGVDVFFAFLVISSNICLGLSMWLLIYQIWNKRLQFPLPMVPFSIFQGQGLRRCIEEIVFTFTYPRLDMEVCAISRFPPFWSLSSAYMECKHLIPFKTQRNNKNGEQQIQ